MIDYRFSLSLCLFVDATEEYIRGVARTNFPNIPASGLECVTILIGLYDKGNGKPIGGIINQPFAEQIETGFVKQFQLDYSFLFFSFSNVYHSISRLQVQK